MTKADIERQVVVVGAGPAGAAAAFFLAQRGRQVLLLDRRSFPRDKSCGDGLTPRAVRMLNRIGVLERLGEVQRIAGVRVHMRGKGVEEFDYPSDGDHPHYGLVVPRWILDAAILEQARSAGAEVWESSPALALLETPEGVAGVRVKHKREEITIRTRVVVVATGAMSQLVHRGNASHSRLGFAIRAYMTGLADLDDRLEVHMPITDVSDRYVLPSYGWVFPLGNDRANVGIGLFEKEGGSTVRQLADVFLSDLRDHDPRFGAARFDGAWKAAPLRFDFAPERCHRPGMALVGDAAGLVSPFTGEGISYGLESAELAADTIHRRLDWTADQVLGLEDYAIEMERRFTGHFEAGRRSARRYLLMWHVLEDTFDRRGPVFSLARRAVIYPEGVGHLSASRIIDDVSAIVAPGLGIREDLLKVDDVLLNVVRREWPFLGPVWLGGQGDPGIPFRPTLLLLLAARLGESQAPHVSRLGAALEMGYLAALSHLSVEPSRPRRKGRVPSAQWGNMVAVALGDFLLTEAYSACSAMDPRVSRGLATTMQRISAALLESLPCRGDLDLAESRYLDLVADWIGPLFELPLVLGSSLADASETNVDALGRYGVKLGVAFAVADDAYRWLGYPTSLGDITSPEAKQGTLNLAMLRAAAGPARSSLVAELSRNQSSNWYESEMAGIIRNSGVLPGVLATAAEYAESARSEIEEVEPGPVRDTLRRITFYAVHRDPGPSVDLRAFMENE